jgi:hypothetical protein
MHARVRCFGGVGIAEGCFICHDWRDRVVQARRQVAGPSHSRLPQPRSSPATPRPSDASVRSAASAQRRECAAPRVRARVHGARTHGGMPVALVPAARSVEALSGVGGQLSELFFCTSHRASPLITTPPPRPTCASASDDLADMLEDLYLFFHRPHARADISNNFKI